MVTAERRASLQTVVDKLLLCMWKLMFFPLHERTPGLFEYIVQIEVTYKAEI